jgi:hypothetical protein
VEDAVALLADAVALLAALVADVATPAAELDAAVADPEAAVADAAALIACCVTSLILASVVESPAPPLPLYKLIVYPYLLSLSFLFLAACLVLTLP